MNMNIKHSNISSMENINPLDLRSGNTLTINELENWCFEIMSWIKCDNLPFNGTIAQKLMAFTHFLNPLIDVWISCLISALRLMTKPKQCLFLNYWLCGRELTAVSSMVINIKNPSAIKHRGIARIFEERGMHNFPHPSSHSVKAEIFCRFLD